MPLFVVDTIQTYRVKFVIEAETVTHAFDEVVMRDSGNPDNEFDHFTEQYLGYHIIEGQEIDKENLDSMIAEIDSGEDEGPGFVRKIDYKK